MTVVTKWWRCQKNGPGEFSIQTVAVGIAKVTGKVWLTVGHRSAEQPEETGIVVGRNRQAVPASGLGGSLSDGLPSLCRGFCTENLHTVAELAVRPGELDLTSFLYQSQRWVLSLRRHNEGH
jgi:hypothetical protein